MLKLKARFLKVNGRNEFVILPYQDYLRLRGMLEDAKDLKSLRAAKARQVGRPQAPLAEVKRLIRRKRPAARVSP